jgi:hypothetical protein
MTLLVRFQTKRCSHSPNHPIIGVKQERGMDLSFEISKLVHCEVHPAGKRTTRGDKTGQRAHPVLSPIKDPVPADCTSHDQYFEREIRKGERKTQR